MRINKDRLSVEMEAKRKEQELQALRAAQNKALLTPNTELDHIIKLLS